MAISPSPIFSPLILNTNFPSASSRHLPLFTTRQHAVIACAHKSGSGLGSHDKKVLLERYGFDADRDRFLSEPSPKTRKRRDGRKTGRGKEVPEEEAAPPPRTTHKLLQVLGGKAKRKKLLSPQGMDVRPMMEVVKGSVFDSLQSAGGCPTSLRPGCWLDLYSGTGSVGIEAISRGCSEVHFVEMDPWVVSNVLRPNLESTGFLDVSVIHAVRVENFLAQSKQFVGQDKAFDFISVTPPYAEVDYRVLMDQISKSGFIGEDTFIVVEYPLKTVMLDSCGCLIKIIDRRFGRTNLAIYGPKWAQKRRNLERSRQNSSRSPTMSLQMEREQQM